MHYTISFQNPLSHYVDLELSCITQGKRLLNFMIPAWRPGRYELTNYAANIRMFKATDSNGNQLEFKKTSRNCWQVKTPACRAVSIRYQFYANELNAGGSLLDDQQLYLNFVNCLMFLPDRLEDPCMVDLKIKSNFKIACGLPKRGPKQLLAHSYYQLVDCPLIASPHLKQWKFQQSGVTIYLWFLGSHRLFKPKVVKAFKSFIATQVETMGTFPESTYHFLYQLPKINAYHGVEHANNTVIVLGPGKEIHKNRYLDFLGVSSHEFFHSWNVLRIRPKELTPYDYSRETLFETGFVAEGVTTYYGDLFLVRSGVIKQHQYFKELNKLFKRHFDNFGRHFASLIDSSRDLWVDGYKQGAPDRKVSIYTKGALVSLLLDLTIRGFSGNEHSLDDVMRQLWQKHGKNTVGYSLTDFQNICSQHAGQSLQSFFQMYLHGTDSLDEPLTKALESVGCTLTIGHPKQLTKKYYGFNTTEQREETVIQQIAPDSPASDKLSVGDVITSINGKKPKSKLDSQLTRKPQLKLEILRRGRKLKLSLSKDNHFYFWQYQIEKLENPTDTQRENFEKWLGIPLS